MKLAKTTLATALIALAAAAATACVDDFADDCTKWKTCSSVGGDQGDGDGDTGGAGTGGKGTGASDTGGTGGTEDACTPACGGDSPVCDEDAKACVGCLKDGDCDGDSLLCDTEANECVGCLETGDCTDAKASLCEANSCAPCVVDDDCSHIPGKSLCDEGTCVECTPSTDDRTSTDDTCGTGVCNPMTNTCDGTLTQGTKDTCQSCIADNECLVGQNCIPLEYTGGAETVELGGYCMKLFPGCTRPYEAGAINRTSLSGAAATNYCGLSEASTTCQAIADLENGKPCSADTDCGTEYGEGRCEIVNGSLQMKCTYSCTANAECGALFNCGGLVGSKYCGG